MLQFQTPYEGVTFKKGPYLTPGCLKDLCDFTSVSSTAVPLYHTSFQSADTSHLGWHNRNVTFWKGCSTRRLSDHLCDHILQLTRHMTSDTWPLTRGLLPWVCGGCSGWRGRCRAWGSAPWRCSPPARWAGRPSRGRSPRCRSPPWPARKERSSWGQSSRVIHSKEDWRVINRALTWNQHSTFLTSSHIVLVLFLKRSASINSNHMWVSLLFHTYINPYFLIYDICMFMFKHAFFIL